MDEIGINPGLNPDNLIYLGINPGNPERNPEITHKKEQKETRETKIKAQNKIYHKRYYQRNRIYHLNESLIELDKQITEKEEEFKERFGNTSKLSLDFSGYFKKDKEKELRKLNNQKEKIQEKIIIAQKEKLVYGKIGLNENEHKIMA